MDPVTFLVVTYVFAYLASERVRKATHGTARTVWGGVKRLVTSGGSKGASPSPGPSLPVSPKPSPTKGQGTSPKTPAPVAPTPASSPSTAGTGRTFRVSLPRRPKNPDAPPLGVPVKTTQTRVTTIRSLPAETPGASPVTTAPAPSQPSPSPGPSSGKHTAPAAGDGTVTGGAEKIPAHMDASDRAAAALEKVVGKFRQIAATADTGDSGKAELRAVITNASAAEKLHIIREPLAAHKDAAASAHQALAAIARFQEAAAAAAKAVADCEERAKSAAKVERAALSSTVEAVRSAPVADPANAGSLRG